MARTAIGLVAIPPMRVPILIRMAELAHMLGYPRVAIFASDRATKAATEYGMQLHRETAKIYSPELSIQEKHEKARDMRISFGSTWHSERLSAVIEAMTSDGFHNT